MTKKQKQKRIMFWTPIKTPEVNLIQDNLLDNTIDKKKYLFLFLLNISFPIILIIILYSGLVFWEKNIKKNNLDFSKNIQDLEKNKKTLQEKTKEIDDFQNRLTVVQKLIDNHIYWNNFFKFLEENTLPNIYYTGNQFAGDTNGNYSFSAEADDYLTVVKQIKVLKENPQIKSVEVAGLTSLASETEDEEQTKIKFNLNIQIDPKIFLKSNKNDSE